ncbi:MAG: methionine--tRNA ligase [Armatimonadetes bacterium]|nr:methionine--tRNA ligase [Armatimonadota bacterium]
MSKAFYVTTPIYYVSGRPHLGSAYTTIAADVLARYHALRGERVVFATGTDEHGEKVAREAAAAGKPVQVYVDEMAQAYVDLWEQLHIRYDRFIRTSEPQHVRVVQAVFSKLLETGDIYLGEYAGWYCVPCEAHLLESEVQEGCCPDCGRAVERISQPAYFLRTSRYAQRLLDHIEANEEFILPDTRRREVIGFIRQGLQDACISRARSDWDIPVPGDDTQSVYVWFDALINYLTVAGYPDNSAQMGDTWPPDVQLMGKDILPRFHATIWPALLMALGLPLPRTLFAHGWWLADTGDKMSKSKGNFIYPQEVAEELCELSGARTAVAIDALRYFVLREVPFGLDGTFGLRTFIGRFNADLANDLGNLLNRSLPLVDRYLGGVVPEPGPGAGELADDIAAARDGVEAALAVADYRGALEAIWELLGKGNKFLDTREPWTLHRDGKMVELQAVLYDVLDVVRSVAILISPFMPVVAEDICDQLGLEPSEALQWRLVEGGKLPPGTRTRKESPIFPRVDMARMEAKLQAREAAVEKDKDEERQEATTPLLSFDEFRQMDLRVARVLSAEKIAGADKLLKLQVDAGEPTPRQLVAGIAQEFSVDELVGKLVVVITNLQPAKIRGVESNGMVLAAGAEKALALLTVDRDCPVGTRIR